MSKTRHTIIMIHGRGTKPPKLDLEKVWKEALFFAVRRDHPSRLPLLEKAHIEFVYYGHYANTVLLGQAVPDPPHDIPDRWEALNRLMRFRANEFTDENFRSLPGWPPRGDALVGGIGALAQRLRMGRRAVEWAAKDIAEYWNQESRFGKKIRSRLLDSIKTAMDRKDRILLLAHSMGTIIAWDSLWQLSRGELYKGRRYDGQFVDLLITLGSPLGEQTARKMLSGYGAGGADAYPANIRTWLNLCAEGDTFCARPCITEQFKPMLDLGLVECIEEKRIFNLTVRHGKCTPHSPIGYLVHPETSHAVNRWLQC